MEYKERKDGVGGCHGWRLEWIIKKKRGWGINRQGISMENKAEKDVVEDDLARV